MFHRAGAGSGHAVLDFPKLLGDVDVQHAAGRQGDERRQLGRGGGAQRVRREAEARVGQGGDGAPGAFEQGGVAVEVGDEAALGRRGRGGVEAAMGVEHRQQRQADAGLRGGAGDARGELGRVGVGGAVRGVVQIVELGHRGEAGLQHLHVGERGDRLDVVGGEDGEEAVHHLAPGPEIAAALGQARHAALEGVAVQVGHAGQRDAGEAGGVVRWGAGVDGGDAAVRDGDADVAGPAGGEQGGGEEEVGHGAFNAR